MNGHKSFWQFWTDYNFVISHDSIGLAKLGWHLDTNHGLDSGKSSQSYLKGGWGVVGGVQLSKLLSKGRPNILYFENPWFMLV